ncbi:heme/copper-type cytochrome/quinol oxidase subunit 2 [Chryseobacterium ginsenosidimutans]|uniref:hypothetical protein n=1 Tax=Chryseobacterium ginsenosidimutans TaxID=687846 RepID=UPI0021690A8A|nr:hypothetical protein [Chryseobacterium ginsenosidimutans]MCS3870841.1 heme/copper-type cytochrome/quinol oxidase subunit 2 [Chryseobacterium ginsenosidimutans]
MGSKASHSDVLFYYQNFEDIYNGKKNDKKNQIPIRYLAIAPWVVYTVTLVACLIDVLYSGISPWLIFGILTILSFFILYFLNKKFQKIYDFFNKNKQRKDLLKIVLGVSLLIILSPLVVSTTGLIKYPQIESSEIDNFYNIFLVFLIFYNVLGIILMFLYLVHKENETEDAESNYNFSFKLHKATIALSTLLVVCFCALSLIFKLIWISPTVILVVLSTFFILIFELLYTTPRIIVIIDHYKTAKYTGKYDKLRYVFYLVLVIIVARFVFMKEKTIYLREYAKNSQKIITRNYDNRVTLDDYFIKWLEVNHKISEKNDETIDVVLISGQGGGSKAGSWILANLLNVEATNPQFYKNIFSFSTVSGSSNGANFYFALKTKNILSDKSYLKRGNLISDIYNKNYFSSNFLGLMFSDYFVNPIAKEMSGDNIDRNYILQKEEKNALLSSVKSLGFNKEKEIEDYFNQNYLSIWYNNDKKKVDLLNPLFFINSACLNEGRKAIFSPVKLDKLDMRVKDILKEFESSKEANESYIPISAAVAQSQAFPLLSNYNYVPETGYLGDGGFYENTGTSTTLDVYKRLKYIAKNNYPNKKIRFVLINFISEEDAKNSKKERGFQEKSALYQTLNQAYKTPFNGHATDALNLLRIEAKRNGDPIVDIGNSGEFATTRLMSNKTLAKMLVNSNTPGKGSSIIVDLFKSFALKENKKLLSYENQAPNTKVSIVYIQYSKIENKKLIQNLNSEIKNEINNEINGKEYKAVGDSNYIFRAPGIENVPSFKVNEIRYFHTNDRGIAERLSGILKKRGIVLTPKKFDYKSFSSAVPKGQLELWIDNVGNYGKKSEQPSAKR